MPVQVRGIDKLKRQLEALSLKGTKQANIEVTFGGPGVPYALYVHENLVAKWRGKEIPRRPRKGHSGTGVGVYWGRPYDSQSGEPKFLENAYRSMKDAARKLIREKLKAKRSLFDACLAAARLILADALRRVPIETGKLFLSGKIKIIEGAGS